VIEACARHGKIVEINNHSFGHRPGSEENCLKVALLCMRFSVRIAVGSDAHFWPLVGKFDHSIKMLRDINFPEPLVVNADERRFAGVLQEKSCVTY
jgi:putative hydrolase